MPKNVFVRLPMKLNFCTIKKYLRKSPLSKIRKYTLPLLSRPNTTHYVLQKNSFSPVRRIDPDFPGAARSTPLQPDGGCCPTRSNQLSKPLGTITDHRDPGWQLPILVEWACTVAQHSKSYRNHSRQLCCLCF